MTEEQVGKITAQIKGELTENNQHLC